MQGGFRFLESLLFTIPRESHQRRSFSEYGMMQFRPATKFDADECWRLLPSTLVSMVSISR